MLTILKSSYLLVNTCQNSFNGRTVNCSELNWKETCYCCHESWSEMLIDSSKRVKNRLPFQRQQYPTISPVVVIVSRWICKKHNHYWCLVQHTIHHGGIWRNSVILFAWSFNIGIDICHQYVPCINIDFISVIWLVVDLSSLVDRARHLRSRFRLYSFFAFEFNWLWLCFFLNHSVRCYDTIRMSISNDNEYNNINI